MRLISFSCFVNKLKLSGNLKEFFDSREVFYTENFKIHEEKNILLTIGTKPKNLYFMIEDSQVFVSDTLENFSKTIDLNNFETSMDSLWTV